MSVPSVLSPPTVDAMLEGSPIPQLRRLLVTANDDEVVITGRVTSYYHKQLAQETVRPAVGGRTLHNRVEVCPVARI